jgi:hypothetical protein
VPTPTRPKAPSALYSFTIELSDEHYDLLLECLDIHQQTELERVQIAIAAIEHDLSACFNFIHRGADAPLPAHIVAALKPVAAHAEQLANLVNPANLPAAVLSTLALPALDSGRLCLTLQELAVAAQVAIARLSANHSAGLHVKRAGERLQAVQSVLETLFTRLRPPPVSFVNQDAAREYQDSKQDFISICRGYLPRMPTARKR